MPQESRPALGPNPPTDPPCASSKGASEGLSGTPGSGGLDAPLTIAGFQALIRDRYYATDAARGVPGTFMWFMEEVGELATALQDNAPGKSPTDKQRANLEEEFADVLTWLMTLANIAGVDARGIDVEHALEKYTRPGRVEGVKG